MFSARSRLRICATLQKFKAKAGKKQQQNIWERKYKAWKAEMKVFYSRKKKSLPVFRKMSWTVILKIPLTFSSRSENKVLCHSVFLYLRYPVALRELLFPTRDVAEQFRCRDQPCCSAVPGGGHGCQAAPPPCAAGRQLGRVPGFVSCEVGRKSSQKKRSLLHIAKRGKRNQMGLQLG